MTLAFLEGIGSPLHWLVIAFVALLIFGRRLPEVGRSLGKGITEFKKGLKDVGQENSGEVQDPYQQNQQIAPPNRAPQQFQQPQQGGYQQNPYQQQPQRMNQPAQGGQSQVRVTRNDMVD